MASQPSWGNMAKEQGMFTHILQEKDSLVDLTIP